MNVPFLPDGCDLGCKMTVRLRQLLPITTGSVQKVLASLACMSPHSMQTERIVSHHNLVVDNHRTSMGEDTRNARLIVALNIVGTAYFDPRPALVKFPENTRRWGLQIWTSTGSVNSLGNSLAKRGSSNKIETTVKRTDLQVARDVFSTTASVCNKTCFWDICVTLILYRDAVVSVQPYG